MATPRESADANLKSYRETLANMPSTVKKSHISEVLAKDFGDLISQIRTAYPEIKNDISNIPNQLVVMNGSPDLIVEFAQIEIWVGRIVNLLRANHSITW